MSLMTTNDVAKVLRVSTPTVRRLIRNGALSAYRIGGVQRIDASQLVTLLKGGNTNATNDN